MPKYVFEENPDHIVLSETSNCNIMPDGPIEGENMRRVKVPKDNPLTQMQLDQLSSNMALEGFNYIGTE